ncbi:hypothetical protein JTB14_009723 [Gonioctena quinquepunctata]|nr:hypothetical protein JTB14_009723 [Gonioctena quinquepunctata]
MSVKGKIKLLEEENQRLTNQVKSLHRILRKHNLFVFGLDNSDISENLLCLSRSLGIELSTSDSITDIPLSTKITRESSNDLSPEEQVVHKAPRGHLNNAKKIGVKATIRNYQLVINNDSISLDDLESSPNYLNGYLIPKQSRQPEEKGTLVSRR